MKIEMGESLFYSWLRHVKECQVVQTNWKASPSWQLHNEDELAILMQTSKDHFASKGYNIYKNNTLSQLLLQAEVDALGIASTDSIMDVYAIDVAYHEGGLNYGDRKKTTERVILKCLRTAMCVYGYFNTKCGEIIFASPKIGNAFINDILPCIADVNRLLTDRGFNFTVRVLANDDFNENILKPILIASEGISDTSELFLRAYQLTRLFENKPYKKTVSINNAETITGDALSELKIGKIAQAILRDILESGNITPDEIEKMQTKEYSKDTFGIDFPLLVADDSEFDAVRYYAKPLIIDRRQYYLCSQWFEVPANNDRSLLVAWINHMKNG